jgi:hypothetical protein
MVPGWINTEGVNAFFVEVLGLTAAEVCRKFELWECAKADGKYTLGHHPCHKCSPLSPAPKTSNVSAIQQECTRIIFDDLCTSIFASSLNIEAKGADVGCVLGRKDVQMNYQDYDQKIRLKLGIELRGWPAGVKQVTPSSIGGLDDLRLLREALT